MKTKNSHSSMIAVIKAMQFEWLSRKAKAATVFNQKSKLKGKDTPTVRRAILQAKNKLN
jgi:hypothetical protein